MTDRWVCRICVAENGLKAVDLSTWPEAGDIEAITAHVETVHHMPVRRPGESVVGAKERFYTAVPTAGPGCKCPSCNMAFPEDRDDRPELRI